MIYVLDTNILVDYPQAIENFIDETIIIPLAVLNEVDALKKHINPDLAEKARKASYYIIRNFDKILWEQEETEDSVDDFLIKVAKKYDATLVTNDVYLRIKAEINDVPAIDYYSTEEDYCGIYYWYLDLDENYYNKSLETALSTGENPIEDKLYENQYVIAKDKDKILAYFIYKDQKLNTIYPEQLIIKNKYINQILPKNAEQACYFYSLKEKSNTIMYCGGQYGTGKSFITNNYALQELERGKIAKIVYVPNNSYTNNTIDVGALPGGLLDKTVNQIGPLVDLVGVDRIEDMIARGELEVVPMSFIRGRSFNDAIIIVNEAQNLTEDHVKLLIGRCGENTRIIFDGDIKQTDAKIFKNKNGLKLLLKLKNSPRFSKIFSTVKLVKTERSETAEAASYLDSYVL